MEKIIRLDKETFLHVVRHLGLDEKDSHLEELYIYVDRLYPDFKVAGGFDLDEIEPMPSLVLPKE